MNLQWEEVVKKSPETKLKLKDLEFYKKMY